MAIQNYFQALLTYIFRLLFLGCFSMSQVACFNTDKKTDVDKDHISGFTIKGISMVAPVNAIDATVLEPIINVNANSIAIMPYAFCTPENPVIQFNHNKQWWGESDAGVISSIQLAHSKKLSVMLKPHLWIAHGMYTGVFTLQSESAWKLWEDSYRDYIIHFANIADSLKAELFCIGVELGGTIKQRPQFWSWLIDSIRQVYHGKLTYAANWDDYKTFPFWTKMDYIGIDAYFPLATDKTPSVNSIKKGWQKYSIELEQVSKQLDRPVLFTEYGYRNVDYNSAEPWKENEGHQNDGAQTNAYEAFFQIFSGKKWFAGGYVWKWYVDESEHHKREIDFTPQDKPAANLIKKWYSN